MRFAVIGSPVAHSRSPAMHAAAYRALGLSHTYEKIETTAAELAARVAALRAGELAGINVTVPHKTAVLALVDEVAATAAAIGAANTLVRSPDGRITAHNTDAPAIAEELTRLGGPFAGKSALVIGSGGAARGAVFALGSLGVARIVVRARREVPDLAAVLTNGVLAFEPLAAGPLDDLAAIVQCTTAGMHGGPPGSVAANAVDWASVPATCVAYDVVYSSGQTPFLAAAAKRGLACDGGVGMLVAQGALAFELWLGVRPPRDIMRAAVLSTPA